MPSATDMRLCVPLKRFFVRGSRLGTSATAVAIEAVSRTDRVSSPMSKGISATTLLRSTFQRLTGLLCLSAQPSLSEICIQISDNDGAKSSWPLCAGVMSLLRSRYQMQRRSTAARQRVANPRSRHRHYNDGRKSRAQCRPPIASPSTAARHPRAPRNPANHAACRGRTPA